MVLLVFSSPSSMLQSKKVQNSVLHVLLLVFHNQKLFGIIIKVFFVETRTDNRSIDSVPLKNGEDYQYKVNGTIYSLNMDECFREDEGIYTIRSVLAIFEFSVSLSDAKESNF